MRTFIILAFLLFSPSSLGEVEKADITVLQVNTQWNKQHNIDLNNLIGCEVQFAWLEDQSDDFKVQVQTVPIIVVYHKNRPVRQWSADLSFRLNVDLEEIQQVIDKL
ncbi:hypothetical protein OAP45_02795 [Candidatus Pelagibacter sp.]|nr:hypothetical protein [Candidatus Pelagibacter sp.]